MRTAYISLGAHVNKYLVWGYYLVKAVVSILDQWCAAYVDSAMQEARYEVLRKGPKLISGNLMENKLPKDLHKTTRAERSWQVCTIHIGGAGVLHPKFRRNKSTKKYWKNGLLDVCQHYMRKGMSSPERRSMSVLNKLPKPFTRLYI